jgi:hypothetical protein
LLDFFLELFFADFLAISLLVFDRDIHNLNLSKVPKNPIICASASSTG